MEQPVAQAKQRSPWLYVLLGCGGLAGLICLGGAIVVGFFGKAVKDMSDGVTDPTEKVENAKKQLGAIPEGYQVVASLSLFGLMNTTVLTNAPALPDGGYELGADSRTFTYFRITANENNKRSRDFLMGKDTDATALAQSGINIKAQDVVKRGQLVIDGRKHYYVASRGQLDTGSAGEPAQAINNAVLFDCGTEALHVGIWSQRDPAPEKAPDALDLTGSVADEEVLAGFLKPLRPCAQ